MKKSWECVLGQGSILGMLQEAPGAGAECKRKKIIDVIEKKVVKEFRRLSLLLRVR